MKEFPILIGGCPRSGTTALLQLLNSDIRVYISSEEDLVQKHAKLIDLLSTKEKRTKKMSGKIRELSERESLNDNNIHSHNFTLHSAWPVIRYIYKHHHKMQNTREELELWGDKLPNYYKNTQTIIKEPWAKYIHITRNPFDVVNSMVRRTEMASKGKDWWSAITNSDEMIGSWSNAYQAISQTENHSSILHVHYEELVFNAPLAIKKISDFCEFKLNTTFKLNNDKTKHYERHYLNNQIIDKILSNTNVQNYLANYENSREYPAVSDSLNIFDNKLKS